jgi:hypothetical protein
MKYSRRIGVGFLVAALVVVGAGFLMVYPGGRGLVGDYRLSKLGDRDYRLQDTRLPENQLGNQGAVVRIGWDRHRILAQRLASPTPGTPWSNEAGWVVIDVDRHVVSPTMTQAEFWERQDLSSIVTYSPDSAYQRGRRW